MGGTGRPLDAVAHLKGIVRSAHVECTNPNAVTQLADALGRENDFALVVLYVSPDAKFRNIVNQAVDIWGAERVVACTTAGELGEHGYTEGTIAAIGLPRANFCVGSILINHLEKLDPQEIVGNMIRLRTDLNGQEPDWQHEFAFVAIDGLSIKEDEVVAAVVSGLGPVPLFGGSAGDGDRFQETYISVGGQVYTHAAVLCFIRTNCPVHVFSLDHLTPTDTRMVVTEADSRRRIVRRINAEPAAREYARILGKDPEQLSAFTFAAHPVVVRFGGTHHVRAIQRVLDNGDLVFFSAIDEGLVLTLAEPEDMAIHLDRELKRIGRGRTPQAIIACDCILRRLEAEQKQRTGAISDILARNKVVGFSTYGEQINGMHVNQTMTGVAIFAPEDGL